MSDQKPEAEAKTPAETPKPEKNEFYEQLLKLKAEFENYRKRVDRERPEWIQTGRSGLLNKLLPLYDVLLHAHEQVASAEASGPAKEIVKGLELIFKEFTKVFESEGVTPIETVGKPYHYDQHEALGFVETDEWVEGTVVEELQRGYLLNGKVLRPARVRVAKTKQADLKSEPGRTT
ncbi:MAG: nucleotide exchange factor GrpE [Elusimicrobia bacterium]|nr:nucleotide exchange factor GrpE [Elusimicrobiota bacterium]